MGWGASVAKIIKAAGTVVAKTATPAGGGGGIAITGSQHIDNSVNTNVTAGDNSFNEDKSTTLGAGAVQSNTTTSQTATGGGSLAKDSAERSQEGVQSAIAGAAQVGQDAFMSQSRSADSGSDSSASPSSGMSKALVIGGVAIGGVVLLAVLVFALKKGR